MDLYVSLQGDDNSIGSIDKPVKTVQKALDLSRGQSGNRTIHITHGVYENVSLILDERDSGLRIKGADNALLSGGISITDWIKCDDGSYCAVLPADISMDFRLITVNGEMRERAKYPSEGRLEYKSKFESKWMSTSAGGWDIKPTLEQLTTMEYDPKDISADFDWRNADITVFHKWDDSMSGIKAHQEAENIFIFLEALTHPPGGFDTTTYVIWNTKEGMIPGKWRVDRQERKIYYLPLSDEDITKARIFIPVQQVIISLTAEIDDLIIDNLSFIATSNPTTPCGFGTCDLPGAINSTAILTNSVFKNLRFTGLSGWGINLVANHAFYLRDEETTGNIDVTVKDCEIKNTGGGGIQFRGNSNCLIEGNIVSQIGRIYYSAVGISANNCDIVNNDLDNLPYSGIVLGKGRGTLIRGNKINNAINFLNDGAGIYVTFCEQGIMRDNIVTNVSAKGHQSQRHGLYLDEQANNWVVEGNVTVNCPSALLCHMNYREGNLLRNNTFICHGSEMMVVLIRCKNHQFVNNTFHASKDVVIAGGQGSISRFDENRLFSVEGEIKHRYVSDDYVWEEAEVFDGSKPLA